MDSIYQKIGFLNLWIDTASERPFDTDHQWTVAVSMAIQLDSKENCSLCTNWSINCRWDKLWHTDNTFSPNLNLQLSPPLMLICVRMNRKKQRPHWHRFNDYLQWKSQNYTKNNRDFEFFRIDLYSIEGNHQEVLSLSHFVRKMGIYTAFDFILKLWNFPVNDLQRIY